MCKYDDLLSFCKKQKWINAKTSFYLTVGMVFGFFTDFRFAELNREIGELKLEIERLKYREGD